MVHAAVHLVTLVSRSFLEKIPMNERIIKVLFVKHRLIAVQVIPVDIMVYVHQHQPVLDVNAPVPTQDYYAMLH